ncbi:MAG: hypothetical protein CFH10_01753 [Alphaproteobacteria bacterium MarineAlpha4_Bin2]|nr:MAG: hypothetical protein CFH10_01753 [Alphaproteobacteria bacterium MarineAlpha4_Bin2]
MAGMSVLVWVVKSEGPSAVHGTALALNYRIAFWSVWGSDEPVFDCVHPSVCRVGQAGMQPTLAKMVSNWADFLSSFY